MVGGKMRVYYYLIFVLFISITNVFAHGGADNMQNLKKNKQSLSSLQKSFANMENVNSQIDNIESQLLIFQRNVFILRDAMVDDFPGVKSRMSKYQINYLEEVDKILKKFNRTLKLTEKILVE